MKDKEVYVVTNPELGWDCVCGVFTSYDKAAKYCAESDETKTYNRNKSSYIIHDITVE